MDQTAHALRLAVNDGREVAAVIGAAEIIIHQGFGEAGNGGQRRGQFMGGIADELGLTAIDFLEQ